MKNKEEKKAELIFGDKAMAYKDKAVKKKKHAAQVKDEEALKSNKKGKIIKIREKIDTLLEKIEKIEKFGVPETAAEKTVFMEKDIQTCSKSDLKEKKPTVLKDIAPLVEPKKSEELEKKWPTDIRDSSSTKPSKWTDYKLKKEILLGIQKKGFTYPSPVQAATMLHSLKNLNIVARSKNGTGKTAAFAIPLLNKINPHKLMLQGLILVPTRELVLQTAKVCKELGEFLRLKIIPLYGGLGAKDDVIRMKEGAHIIIGTPGRVLDFLNQKILCLDKCMHLICDEADKLLSTDFKEVLQEITNLFPKKRQIEMYSATFPAMIQDYIDRYMPNTVKINLMKELTLSGVKQYYAYVKPINKLHCLKSILSKLDQLNQCFIFCNSILTVEKLAKRMIEFGTAAYYIHSKMKQEERNLVFHNFTLKSECRILVSTDLVTRGIDVPSVNVVINFDLPKSTESYLHRIGRSGRFGTEGIAINMVTPNDVFKIREIETDLGIDINPFSDNI